MEKYCTTNWHVQDSEKRSTIDMFPTKQTFDQITQFPKRVDR